MPLIASEKDRLIGFLLNEMCGPCKRDGAISEHEGCIEAEALIEIVARA